jgi:ABC-type transport system involved in cytochrome c biogenesis permease subunit
MIGAIWVGFVTLTGAVLTGAFWAERLYHNAWMHDSKILFTLAIWALYGAALLMRRLRRWQGRQTALASLTGFGVILFSLMAVNLFLTGFHGFL